MLVCLNCGYKVLRSVERICPNCPWATLVFESAILGLDNPPPLDRDQDAQAAKNAPIQLGLFGGVNHV